MKFIISFLLLTFFQHEAISKVLIEYSNQHDKDPWNPANNPHILNRAHLDKLYNYHYSELKVKNSLTQLPWSDDYWPTHKGGISYRWSDDTLEWFSNQRYGYQILSSNEIDQLDTKRLSPSEKYDIYVGQYNFPLTQHERKRTQIMRTVLESEEFDTDFEIPTWEGLCHGWAPATLLFKNPNPVTLINDDGIQVSFGSSDIKALLTFFLHYERSSETSFLGERCNTNFDELSDMLENGDITQEEYEHGLIEQGCADVNPGALHVILANEIENNRGFIIDITRDFEVWNQPVYAYEYKELSRRSPNEKEYKYGTNEVIEIEMNVSYILESISMWERIEQHEAKKTERYHYELEIDKSGEIIGGKWISFNRPDFIWMQKKPRFKGFFKKLEYIYKKSIEQ